MKNLIGLSARYFIRSNFNVDKGASVTTEENFSIVLAENELLLARLEESFSFCLSGRKVKVK